MMRRSLLAAPLLAVPFGVPAVVRAQTAEKLGIGYTTGDSLSAFMAKDRGLFAAAGFDVTVSYIAMNSNMPAALMSHSLQVGAVTSTVFLQAVDNGIDLVALVGGTSVGPKNADTYGIVVRSGLEYTNPRDLIGKKVGVPGLGAIMHVLFVEWLRGKGIKAAEVTMVEATFPAMPDLLKAGTLDAVLSLELFTKRMASMGVGRFVGSFVDDLPAQVPGLIYVATRDWATANQAAARAVRTAITEGAAYGAAHPDEARVAIGSYTKLPPEVVAHLSLPDSTPALPADSFSWMIEVMRRQDLLHGAIDQAHLRFA